MIESFSRDDSSDNMNDNKYLAVENKSIKNKFCVKQIMY